MMVAIDVPALSADGFFVFAGRDCQVDDYGHYHSMNAPIAS